MNTLIFSNRTKVLKAVALAMSVMLFALLTMPFAAFGQEPDVFVPGVTNTNTNTSGGVGAGGGNQTIQQIVTDYIVKGSNYAVVFLVGLTVLVFMYGLMKYMFKGASSDTARTEGRKLMLWGIIGITVMISVWGLVGILSSTIGHQARAVPQFSQNGQVNNQPVTPNNNNQTVNQNQNQNNQGARGMYQRLRENLRRLFGRGNNN